MSVMTEPSIADVLAVTEEVWTSFLGGDDPLMPGPVFAGPVAWSSSVSISGDWEGAVSLELSAVAAEAVAHRMLGVDVAVEEDLADAVGEMVNMIGGNVKGLVDGVSALSLPLVAAGRVARPSDAVEVCRADLIWLGEPVRISVHMFRPVRP